MFNLTYKFCNYKYIICQPAVQYDTGQQLKINNLPPDCEAHWVYESMPADVEVDVRQFEDGICDIPDLCFLTSGEVKCLIYQKGEQANETLAEILMTVKPREKPTEYIESDDVPRLQDLIQEEIHKYTLDGGNYEELNNKPSINNVELVGNKNLKDLNIQEGMTEFTNLDILKIWNEH